MSSMSKSAEFTKSAFTFLLKVLAQFGLGLHNFLLLVLVMTVIGLDPIVLSIILPHISHWLHLYLRSLVVVLIIHVWGVILILVDLIDGV